MQWGAGPRAYCLLIVGLALASAAGCHREKRYETTVEVTRISTVVKESGKPVTIDLEVSYVDCPGTQLEIVRGDAMFAACVAQYKVGDRVKVSVQHLWDNEGYYRWAIDRVGECAHRIDPHDEGSYAVVRECEDTRVNGERVGFQCRYVPEKALVDACPWFRRR